MKKGHWILISFLWGNLQGKELLKFTLLSLGFFFLIGAFWPLKTLKESIFINIIGVNYLPYAKLFSLIVLFPLVLFYSKLVDYLDKEKLIYVIVFLYGIFGYLLIYFLCSPTIGLSNTQVSPYRLIGWIFYLFVESFITIMLSLYWSFINDITTPESAKRGYGFIVFGTQLGGFLFILLGNYLSYDPSKYSSMAPLIAGISVTMFFMIAFVVFLLKRFVDVEELQGYEDIVRGKDDRDVKKYVGFGEGLWLLLTRSYVGGIFLIIFLQEVTITLIGFQFILLIKSTYLHSGFINKFLFNFALGVQGIACLFALLGTSYFQRKCGIRFCLIAYPFVIGGMVIICLLNPTLQSLTYLMLITKSLSYAFNQPAKEALYIPTTKSIKYKSKAWIDMFGLRFAKTCGSLINGVYGNFIGLIGGIVISFIGIWIIVANVLGRYFAKIVDNKDLID